MRKTAISLLLLLLLTACSNTKTEERNGSFELANHFNEICGFELPNSIKILHEFDNGEGQAEALYSVDKNELEDFAKQNNFISFGTLFFPDTKGLLKEGKAEVLARYDLKMNNDEKYKLQNFSNLIAFQICKDQNLITLIADMKTKLLWLKNEYPDMAGDTPNCE